jgi:bacteriocin biosynthesis cyclodehydratase domain-containing protein
MTIQYPAAFLDKKLQLTPGWLMYFPSPNEVHISKSAGAKPDFSLRDAGGELWIEQTFRRLNGQHSLQDIIASAPAVHQQQLRHLLENMHGRYLFDTSLQHTLLPPWLTQQLALNYTAIEHYVQQLQHKSVTIIGTGWLAEALLPLLNKLQLPHISWLTPLTRETSGHDFVRQQVYSDTDNLLAMLDQLDSDLVIYAEDHFDMSLLKTIDLNSRLTGKRWLFSLVDGWNIALGPCFVPGETSCLQCWLQQQPYYQQLAQISELAQPDITTFQRQSVNPAFCQIAAGLIATDLPNLLMENTFSNKANASFLLGQETRLNMQTLQTVTHHIYQDQQCQQCTQTTEA